MKTNTILCIFAAAALTSLLAACSGASGQGSQQPVLAVSIEPQRKMLEELAGDGYSVVSMLPPGANPETYEPTVRQRRKLSDAQAFFVTGHLPFEQVLVADMGRGTDAVDTSAGIEAITGTHQHGADHDHAHEADPHVWASVRNAKVMAANMAAALAQLDPDNAPVYAERLAIMMQRLDSLDQAVEQQLQQAGAHAFAVWHPSLSYFARDYGLHQIAVGQESKEASIASIKAIIDEAKADSVGVFFFQKEYDSRQAQSINAEIGSRLVNINPAAYDWEQEISLIADELSK